MKKTLFALQSLLLVAVMVLALACLLVACGKTTETPPTTTEPYVPTHVSDYVSTGNFTKLEGMLKWEDINSFPIKRADMSLDEARTLCVDFFRFSKTALWIADDDYQIFSSDGEVSRTVEKGKVYGGLPYVGVASGNVYRMMDYLDTKTGVMNVKALGENPMMFGNQCSIAAWWGWARVINSAQYQWSYEPVVSKGFVKLGPHEYDPTLKRFTTTYGTDECVKENGTSVMFESYAELKKGDGVFYMTTAGHIVMIASDAVVVRNADNTINPIQSYVTVLDQTGTWTEGVNNLGETYTYEANVDARWSFMDLYNGNYMPFTFKEFTGEDPIEDTVITYSHTGDTITRDQLYASQVDCNYSLADAYASVYDSKGNEVVKVATRAHKANIKTLKFVTLSSEKSLFEWGSWDDLSKDETYTVKIYAQIGTGERPVLWEGKLAQ